jgi:hypothetical protein
MKRLMFLVIAALVVVASGFGTAWARQGALVDDRLAALGLPELEITLTPDGFEGLPAETPAGRYLVTTRATDDVIAEGVAFDFLQPVGISSDELLAIMNQPADAMTEQMHGSPEPSDEGAAAGPPAFLFNSLYAGGVGVLPGESVSVVLDLTPGEWIISSTEPEATQAPTLLVATGEMPADLPEPESDVTIVIDEYSIEITEGELGVGPTMIRVDNTGAQPHFLLGMLGPDTMTDEAIGAILMGDVSGTPADTGINPDSDLIAAFYTGTQSTGTTQWVLLDLEPGTYAVVCFFPDQADMMPHAFHGMYEVITVGE